MQSVIERQSVGRRRAGVNGLRRVTAATVQTGEQLLSIKRYVRRGSDPPQRPPGFSLSSQRVQSKLPRVKRRQTGALSDQPALRLRLRRRFTRAGLQSAERIRRWFTLPRPSELHLAFGASMVLAVLVIALVLQPGQPLYGMLEPAPQITLPSGNAMDPLRTHLASRDGRYYEAAVDVDVSGFLSIDTSEYELVSGDTLGAIASREGLRLDTLVSFNRISDARRMRAGDTIKVPNRDGVLHTVGRGESLEGIARAYGSSVNGLLDANDLDSTRIDPGDLLFVPDARMNATEIAIILGDAFRWPVRGRISSGFGMRSDPFTGTRRFHNGIDVVNRAGTPVRAAMSGRVVHVENQPGNYGKFVIMRHPRGFQTLYAHLDRIAVSTGQYLSQGQQVGALGSSGRSTGPHLHFSIIENGQFVDPMRHLR